MAYSSECRLATFMIDESVSELSIADFKLLHFDFEIRCLFRIALDIAP